MNHPLKTHYSAPELAKLLSVNVSTVKRWVDNGLLSADVTTGGHRKISAAHLTAFIRHQPKLARSSYIIKRMASLGNKKSFDYRKYYSALFRAKTTSVQNALVDYYISGHSVTDIINEIVLPVLVTIGARWREGSLSISDEHRMTFILRAQLSALESMVVVPVRKKYRTALLACVTDEYHEIPLLLLSVLLKQAGWQCVILGIHTPPREVVRAAVEGQVDLICLAKIYSNIDGLRYIDTVLRGLGSRGVPVALGGAGWHIPVEKLPEKVKLYQSFSEFQRDI